MKITQSDILKELDQRETSIDGQLCVHCIDYPNVAKAILNKIDEKDRVHCKIAEQIYLAAERLGAKSDLLSIIGSYRDTLDDDDILEQLETYNQ